MLAQRLAAFAIERKTVVSMNTAERSAKRSRRLSNSFSSITSLTQRGPQGSHKPNLAALSVIAAEVTKRGDCCLTIGHIAALAGICARSVRNALRGAEARGVLSIEERRLMAFRNDTNIIRITAPEWRAWLRLARGQGASR